MRTMPPGWKMDIVSRLRGRAEYRDDPSLELEAAEVIEKMKALLESLADRVDADGGGEDMEREIRSLLASLP
jgi:hypothetical protein